MENAHREPEKEALAYMWGQYRTFALTAGHCKYELISWRWRVLVLGIGGALLGALCQEFIQLGFKTKTDWSWLPAALGWLSAVCLGLATLFGKELVSTERERRWIRARSLAEALKKEVFLFRTATPPYEGGDRAGRLLERSDELLKGATDLVPDPISEQEKSRGLPELRLNLEDYLAERIDDQINNFYRIRVAELSAKLKRNKSVGLVLGILAVVLGAFGATGLTAGWVAVISTITASLAAYAYAGRYHYLIVSYQATANRLERLRAMFQIICQKDTEACHRFVRTCEDAISIENSGWMSEMVREGNQQK